MPLWKIDLDNLECGSYTTGSKLSDNSVPTITEFLIRIFIPELD
ncbi:MAG: hypothetical protein ACRERD_05765 [Candidatus Binatia bacterium]